ncbi:hypothetical protein BTVI_09742 [Pitangus sulphuratus]|nr:hypothetical protein BTVI_09742 [Pitangus sulphuratus]
MERGHKPVQKRKSSTDHSTANLSFCNDFLTINCFCLNKINLPARSQLPQGSILHPWNEQWMTQAQIKGKAALKVDGWLVATKHTNAPPVEIFKSEDSSST